jgi:AbrB family looped-hinge helix DNA binding protein
MKKSMTTLVKIQRKGQMTLPSELRAAIGVGEGDRLEASVQRGKIILSPTLVIDRSKFPSADREYTPAQRRYIDARLKEAARGPYYGPFKTATEAIKFLDKKIGARKAGKRKTTKS